MTRMILVLTVALAAQPAPPPKKTPAPPAAEAPAQVAPPPLQPAPAPIPFAPLGEPPAAAPGADPGDAVDVVFEDGTLRFLCFDARGWLPDVKRVQVTVGVEGSPQVEMQIYPGAYAPTQPLTQTARLGKLNTLPAAEFQAKLDEAGKGAAEPGLARR